MRSESYIYTLPLIKPEMTKFNLPKSDKNNLRIISKPHAHLQNMTKTPVKFQKDQHNTVIMAS